MTDAIGRSLAAIEYAQWLEKEHPDIFEVLYSQARNNGIGNNKLGVLGDDGITDIQFDPGDIELSPGTSAAIDFASYDPEPVLQNIPISFAPTDSPVSVTNVATGQGSTSGGFGSGLLSALSSVGNWLTSPSGLSSIATIGTTVLKMQETQQAANLKMAVINGNASRAAAGKSVVPITYMTNEQGQTVPVYDTGTMQLMPPELEAAIQQGRAHQVTLADGSVGYAIDNPTLSSLLGVSQIPWYVWAAGASILALALLR